jgi:HAE1 family hydrophobic/amphiphilic exporter-1
MGGILGRLLHEFAVTITASILVSGVVSLTLTPMLCSRFLKPHDEEAKRKHGAFYRGIERFLEGMRALYERTLHASLRHRKTTVGIAGLMVVLTALLAWRLPQGFIPSDDNGQIRAPTEAAQDISFDEMIRHEEAAAAIVAQNPDVAAFMSSVAGGGGNNSVNSGNMFMRLKDRHERKPVGEIIQDLRRQLAAIPGLRVYPQQPPPIRIGGMQSRALYQFTLFGSDLNQLYAAARDMEARIRGVDAVVDVNSDLQISSPQARVVIDRDRAATLGLTPQQIEDSLYSAYGSRQVSTIYTPANQYYVIMEVAPEFQSDPDDLSSLYLRARNGKLVPVNAVARIDRTVGPLTVNHLGQVPAVTVSFNLKPGASLSDATDAITALAQKNLPATVSYAFQGSAQAFASSLKGLGLLLIMAVLVIYIVLGILYEDFIHPLTILSGLPAASFGALFTLWAFHEELNIMGYVGIIMLVGIVKKNAIMMIDFAQAARADGEASAEKAITQACVVRFRPIMMTSFAALAGAIPIALGLGAGAESRRPLGLAVVGGLMVSQLLTLYITPVVYLYLDQFTARLRQRKVSVVSSVSAEKFVAAK